MKLAAVSAPAKPNIIADIATNASILSFGVIEAIVYVEAISCFFNTNTATNENIISIALGIVEPNAPVLVNIFVKLIPLVAIRDNAQNIIKDNISTNILLSARAGFPIV